MQMQMKYANIDVCDAPVSEESVRQFLEDHGVKLAHLAMTPENSFVIHQEGAERALVFNPQVTVLACFPGRSDFLLIHPQLLDIFYEPVSNAPAE